MIFKHSSELGEAPAYKLFDAVRVERIDESAPARKFSDYRVVIDEGMIPASVTCTRMI